MNFFFMLRHPTLQASVTICNFLCAPSAGGVPGRQTAYLAWTDGQHWQIRKACSLEPGESRVMWQSDLPDEVTEGSIVLYFLSTEEFPEQLDSLPLRDTFPTQPNWRANIALHSPHGRASYQGEYPPRLAGVNGGTMLSISPLAQAEPDITTATMFVNIRTDPRIDEHVVRFALLDGLRVFHETTMRNNCCNVVEIPSAPPGPQVAFCTGMSGIPLYLTHDTDFRNMSLEHSLAPLDMMLFDDKLYMQKSMKTWWFERLQGG